MRPDEHKKRKNAQYKKKHGFSARDDKQDTDGRKLSKDKSQGKNEITAIDKKVKVKPVPEEKTETKEAEYDDFRRRKIVSNWSRYDDSSDDDNDENIPTQRGEDFNKLLMEAGGSAAQFRLKDEEDWAEDHLGNGESVLTLDLENLAESLSCIPLHERLGIDKKFLSDEQILEIKAIASENEQKYYSKYPKVSNEDLGKKVRSVNSDAASETATDVKKQTNVSGPQVQRVDNDVNTSMKRSSDEKVVKPVKVRNEYVNTSYKTESKARNKDKEIMSLEDDLDMLLSLDESDSVQSRNNTGDVTNSKSVTGAEKVKVTDKPKTGGGYAPGTAALEEWLDSVLDD